MNVIKSLQIEFWVIVGILVFGAFLGYQECINFWKMDIGFCIAGIGTLWIIASFFRFYDPIPSLIASLAVGGSVLLLGFGIHEYGFFTAFLIVGLGGLYLAYMGHPTFPTQANIIFLVSIILIPLGLALKPFDRPTDPEKFYHPITYSDIKWGVFVYCQDGNGNDIGTNLNYIVGNEESAYKQTRKIVREWKEINPSYKIQEVQVRIPEDLYQEAYDNGYIPTHSLFTKYPARFVPAWCDLRDLQN